MRLSYYYIPANEIEGFFSFYEFFFKSSVHTQPEKYPSALRTYINELYYSYIK
jgi:hypothetical protein